MEETEIHHFFGALMRQKLMGFSLCRTHWNHSWFKQRL